MISKQRRIGIRKVFIFGIGGFGSSLVPVKIPIEIASAIDEPLKNDASILVGDCRGIDTLVQEYLKGKKYKNVCVYYSGRLWRNKIDPEWKDKAVSAEGLAGRAFYTAKDKAACSDADEGIAIWDGKSQGTGRNIKQFKDEGKPVRVYRLDLGKWES